MAETTVETILQTLRSDMKKYIKKSRGYRMTPVHIYYGTFAPDETEKPALGFDLIKEDMDIEYMGATGMAWVEIDIYGYTQNDGSDRISSHKNLAHDALNFIKNDYTYEATTEIIEEVSYNGYKTMMFRLPIRVRYNYNNTTIK